MIQTLLADPVAFTLAILFGACCVCAIFGWFYGLWYWQGIRLPYYEEIAQKQKHISAVDFRERFAALKRHLFGSLAKATSLFAVSGIAFALIMASSVRFSGMAQHPLWVFLIWMLSLLVVVVPIFRVWFVNERAALMRLLDPNSPADET